jgi:uncharacterized repeat protein (TIGR03843 family)
MQLSVDAVLQSLARAEIESLGLLPWSSNYSFLVKALDRAVETADGALQLMAVYKPRAGEAPLWDFPDGTLCLREMAAFITSRALGWNLVPPTVLRNGPEGFGSFQLFIDCDQNVHYFAFRERTELADQLMRLAAFDLITNNADRKSGHCLIDANDKIWAIDHGIAFNAEYKLRTVIWDFANQAIPNDMLADMQHVLEQLEAGRPLQKAMSQLLDEREIKAFRRRTKGLIELGQFPAPSRNQRSVPWPPV